MTAIFDHLECYMLKLTPTKCHSFQHKVTFLGHVLSGQGIECDPHKVAAIAGWPWPTNISEVWTFCGLAPYYWAFVQDFARVTRPHHNLTRKNVPFEWDDDDEADFLELKKWLTSTPILLAPHDVGTHILDTETLMHLTLHWEPCFNKNKMVSCVS